MFYTSLEFVVSISTVFIIAQYIRYILDLKCDRISRWRTIHFRSYALFSLLMCLNAIYESGWNRFESFDRMICHLKDDDEYNTSRPFLIFYFSKIYEMQDIFLWELLGNKCSLNFRIHHNTTLILTWIAMKNHCAANLLCLISNTFMHFLLLFYLNGDFPKFFFWIVRLWGFIQLFIGLFNAFYALHFRINIKNPCNGTLFAELCGSFGYLLYLILLIYDIYINRKYYKPKIKKNKIQ